MIPMKIRSIAILIAALMAAAALGDERIDEDYWSRLTNTYLGDKYSLDTANDGVNEPMMALTGDYSVQYWRFSFHHGVYRMTNMFLGLERSLDTYADGSNAPFMGDSGNHSGGIWSRRETGISG